MNYKFQVKIEIFQANNNNGFLLIFPKLIFIYHISMK